MENFCPHLPIEKTIPLASGLWGSVSRIEHRKVVVKVAKDTGNGLFEIEKKCLERLADSDHVARYLGVTQVVMGEKQKPALLLEYYQLGTLKDFINSPLSLQIRNSRKQQLRWAAQILDALIYIHTRNVVHGDFGIHNVLVNDDLDLKLTDFGGSSIDGTDLQVECAPRYHRHHSWRFPIPGVDDITESWKTPTRKTDTFALGTVLFEIFTGAQLYKNKTYDQIRQHATRKEYPDLNIIDIPLVRNVIGNCWGEKYDNAQEIRDDLQPIWEEGL
ncbi:kinase-like domain-containing protein [Biscogniauxia mediterranea]|nr:kinase-like domain-containing protein [Biscogniauxia mediterranea]